MAAQYHTPRESLDALESLHSAYLGLEVMAGFSDVDSRHVASVLVILNQAFLQQIEGMTPKRFGPRLVD